MKLIFLLLLFLISYFILFACGYRPVTYLKGVSCVAVPIFENRTLYRGYEFELTHKIKKEISERTPLVLVGNPNEADLVISGEIFDYAKTTLVEDAQDQVLASQVAITLKVVIKEGKTGKILYEGQYTQGADMVSLRDETEEKVRSEIFEKLSRWVVSLLEDHYFE